MYSNNQCVEGPSKHEGKNRKQKRKKKVDLTS